MSADYTQLMLAQLAPQFAAQHKPRDPYSARRNFGLGVLQQGASGKPVSGAVEGLARALQAGLGGYLVHQTNEDQDTEEKGNMSALAEALKATGPNGQPDVGAITAALARNPNFQGQAAMMQVANILDQRQRGQATDRARVLLGGDAPPTGIPPTDPATIPGGPLPPPGYSGAGPGPITANNPGNMIDGRGGFQVFAAPDEGVAATIKNFQSYPAKYNGGRPMTLLQIANEWAPDPRRDPGNPMLRGNNPAVWARNVAAASGLPPDQPIDVNDPRVALALVRGIHVAEKGAVAAFPPDIYMRGLQRTRGQQQAGQPQVTQGQPPGPAMPPPASVAAAPPAPGPQVAAAPVEGGGIDDAGQDRPLSSTPQQNTVPVPPGVTVDDGRADMARAQQLMRLGDARSVEDGIKLYQQGQAKALAAQQRAYDRQFKPPERVTLPDGTIAPTTGGAADPAVIERDKAAATRGGGVQGPPELVTGAPATRNTVTGEVKTLPAGDKIRAFDQSARDVLGAADRFMSVFKEQGGGGVSAFLNNPMDPKAQQLLTAYNNMIMALRGEGFANTGVLQPAEIKMLQDQFLSPQTMRGAMASPEAMQAKINELKAFIDLKRRSAYGSAGFEPPPLPGAVTVPMPSAGGGALQQARDAIAKGAPREKVIERLRSMGIDPGSL